MRRLLIVLECAIRGHDPFPSPTRGVICWRCTRTYRPKESR